MEKKRSQMFHENIYLAKKIIKATYRNLVDHIGGLIPDALFIMHQYHERMGMKPDLKDPQRLSEKLQWLKLHDRKDRYTEYADKLLVKDIVADKIGSEHIIPVLKTWDAVRDIDFESLPEVCILKCNHDSGSGIVYRQGITDQRETRVKLNIKLKRDYWLRTREWPYKNIKRKIIAEPYIESLGKSESCEYKITCFNGHAEFITICRGIPHSTFDVRTNDFYDKDFKPLDMRCFYGNSDRPLTEKPAFMDEMVRYAEILADKIPYVRVDFYYIDGKVIFGEMTFYTWAGYTKFDPDSVDLELGRKLRISGGK